jgi:PhoH-like ATPase
VRTRIVLDTSVLVADPGCLANFVGCDVVIPLTVIEELDSLKSRGDDVGRAARKALRTVEELRVSAGGSLADATPVGDGSSASTVKIEINGVQKHLLVEHGLDATLPDNRIIGAALGQQLNGPTCVVSNDAALRIKAAHLGLQADEHRPVGRSLATRPAGWGTYDACHEAIDCLYAAGAIAIDSVASCAQLHENGFAVLRSGSQSALARRVGDDLVLLHHNPPEAWGLRARSKEQLLAVAAGLEQVVESRRYERLAVYRPLVPVGRADVGFLPGTLEDKLDPWMSAIHDALVALTDQRSSNDANRLIDELIGRNQLSLESVTFLRGRSLHRQIVVVDEAQNLEPTTLKTVLTRIGEGTKVIFTGDTSQIDAPYMGESNNALAVLIQAFAGQRCFGHITLTSCERGAVASLAAELL